MTNQEKRKRGPRIKPSIRQLIKLAATHYPNKPRLALVAELTEKIEGMGEIPPSEETLLREISDARHQEPSPLDKPWHLGTVKDYPIPVDVIPRVLKIQKQHLMLTRKSDQLSIRNAQWIARLQNVIGDDKLLARIAWHYSLFEKIAEPEFDSSEYDKLLDNPKELLKRFENLIPRADYSNYKKAFEQVTLGIKYMGPSLPVDHLVIRNNKVYARLMIQGKSTQLEMPYPDPNELLKVAKRQKVIKSIKELKNGVSVIRFNQTISLIFENQEYNEYLHNLITGVKNERSHNTTKQRHLFNQNQPGQRPRH